MKWLLGSKYWGIIKLSNDIFEEKESDENKAIQNELKKQKRLVKALSTAVDKQTELLKLIVEKLDIKTESEIKD